ncbi:MAG: hydrogen peroxide-inducible genes activator [Gammaproteobacteria bacterium]
MNGLSLRELSYVVAVADTGSFTRAAQHCHVSQPTLSSQIRKLEEYLAIQIFERAPRAVRLTQAGEDLIPLARTILEAATAIRERAHGHQEPLSGRLHLGVIPTLGPYLIPRFVPGMQEQYPNLKLVIREDLTENLIRALQAHELDAILAALPVRLPDLALLPLFEEPFWLLAPPGHPLTTCRFITEKKLLEAPLLLLAEGHCLRDQALALCHKRPNSTQLQTDFQASSLETLKQMVVAGFGCTLIPALALDPNDALHGRLVARQMGLPGSVRRVALMWRRSHLRGTDMQLLGRFIQHALPTESVTCL